MLTGRRGCPKGQGPNPAAPPVCVAGRVRSELFPWSSVWWSLNVSLRCKIPTFVFCSVTKANSPALLCKAINISLTNSTSLKEFFVIAHGVVRCTLQIFVGLKDATESLFSGGKSLQWKTALVHVFPVPSVVGHWGKLLQNRELGVMNPQVIFKQCYFPSK